MLWIGFALGLIIDDFFGWCSVTTKRLFLLFIFVALLSGKSRLKAQQVPLSSPPPSPITQISARTSGATGNSTECYWVVVIYPIGNALSQPSCVSRVGFNNGGSVVVTWGSAPQATGYDVLRTATSAFPVSGTCSNCLLASNTSSNSATDTGAALGSFTLSLAPSAAATIYIDNLNFSLPRMVFPNYQLSVQGLWFPDGSNLTTATGGVGGLNQLTGDVLAGPGTGSQAATLATVNSNVGTWGDSTHVGQFTVNGKGLITAVASVAISGGGGGGTPCTTTPSSLQWNNAGAFGCVPDVTFDGTHTVTTGAAGIWDFSAMTGSNMKLPNGTTFGGSALTLGSSSVNFATFTTGIAKITTGTGAFSPAVAADIYGLFTGSHDSAHCTAGDGTMQPCSSAAVGYQTIDNQGSALTQRTTVNMKGPGVTCADNSGSTRTDCTFQGGTGVSSSATFTSQTSVTVNGVNSLNIAYSCYDAETNPVAVEPSKVTVSSSAPYNVTFTFGVAQSGTCIIVGGGGSSLTFTSQTSITVPGLSTQNITYSCFDAETNPVAFEPNKVSVGSSTPYDVTMTFGIAQSGTCNIFGGGTGSGGGGGSGVAVSINGGASVGPLGTLNFIPGTGLSGYTAVVSGSQINITQAIDTAYLNTNYFPNAGNCTSAASPAACGANNSGAVVIAASATTVVVNTTAVTANSDILVTFDASQGARLSVTCNATFAAPWVSARSAGTSFTISVGSAPSVNPACYSFAIRN